MQGPNYEISGQNKALSCLLCGGRKMVYDSGVKLRKKAERQPYQYSDELSIKMITMMVIERSSPLERN